MILSSNEWKLITIILPPGFNCFVAFITPLISSVISLFTKILKAWKVFVHGLIFFLKTFLSQTANQWKNVIYVISQIKFISESNPKFIRNGYFVVKNVGISFQKIVNIHMVEQESQEYKKIML